MMGAQVFTNAEVVSSIVLGGATLGAAGINLLREGRKARRTPADLGPRARWWRRPLLFLILSVALVGAWVAYAAGALDNAAHVVARLVRARQEKPAITVAAVTPIKADPVPARS